MIKKNTGLTTRLTTRVILPIVMLAAILLNAGCFNLEFKHDLDYPAALFSQKVKSLHALRNSSGKSDDAKAANLNFMAYIGKERKLITFSIPTNKTREALETALAQQSGKIGKIKDKIGDIDLEAVVQNLEKLGPGLLLEAEVTKKNQTVHALVWLD